VGWGRQRKIRKEICTIRAKDENLDETMADFLTRGGGTSIKLAKLVILGKITKPLPLRGNWVEGRHLKKVTRKESAVVAKPSVQNREKDLKPGKVLDGRCCRIKTRKH